MFNSLEYKSPTLVTKLIQKSGALNQKNVFWSLYEPRNFGDWIGPYLYERLTGTLPVFCPPSPRWPCKVYSLAGSIMRKIVREEVSIVWGSGIISKQDVFSKPYRICAVRGPYTKARCEELGFSCPEVYGDPAILMPEVFNPSIEKKSKLGIIPHFVDYDYACEAYGGSEEVFIIDVTKSVENVISDINSCEATASSSLHGLIISQSYGIPSAWISLSDNLEGDDVKFLDYFSAGGINAVSAVSPNRSWSAADFISVSSDSPVPNNEALKAPLLASCPFLT